MQVPSFREVQCAHALRERAPVPDTICKALLRWSRNLLTSKESTAPGNVTILHTSQRKKLQIWRPSAVDKWDAPPRKEAYHYQEEKNASTGTEGGGNGGYFPSPRKRKIVRETQGGRD